MQASTSETTSTALSSPKASTSSNKGTCDSSVAVPSAPTSSSNLDEPQPGPSNSAADFDLEVFDSGSSCSLEECWSGDPQKPPLKHRNVGLKGETHLPPTTAMDLEKNKIQPSSCLSETEDDIEEEEEEEDDDEEEVCECPRAAERIIANAASKVANWRCNSLENNSDEIVQDHDNFGTDENEDSLDSMATSLMNVDEEVSAPFVSSASTPPSSLSCTPLTTNYSNKRKSEDKGGHELEISGADVERLTIPLSKKQCISETRRMPGRPSAMTSTTITAPTTIQRSSMIPDKDNPPRAMTDWLVTFSRWSHAERLFALDQLIDNCDPTQVRHMMQVIEPQFQRDFISLLPKELALYVLSFLDPRDLLRAAQTCRYWRILTEDNLLWREKCRESGLDDVREMTAKRRKSTPGFMHSAWKTSFMRQHNIEMNWRIRPIRPPKVLKGHDDHVITCLQFSNNRIISGSDDNTLKVWSATTGKCLRTLMGHTGGVWSSQMRDNIIVSGSTDRTLKVWNADSGNCVHTLYGHTSTVRCMHLHENRVVSGSRDATLRMWDIDSGQCLHVLVGHVAAVRCVQYDGRLVVSGAYDYMVKVWNSDKEECLHTLSGHTNRVYSLQFDGIHVVSGSLDTSIRVWDVETGACKHALMGHQSLTSGMELRNNILVSGNADSTVKVWDITSGQCLQTLSGPNKHQSAVTCLQFNSKFVVTSSDDGTVKLWDVKTGDFVRDLVALESGGSGGVVWRIRANPTKLVCAVGSRNGTEETKLLVLDFDAIESK